MSDHELVEVLSEFLSEYYHDEIAILAQRYPQEQKSVFVSWNDLYSFDHKLADDWLDQPDELKQYAEEALKKVHLPVDVGFGEAHVRLTDLPEDRRVHPGHFSPEHEAGRMVSIDGQVSQRTEAYATMVEAAFECERCGTMSYIPQTGDEDNFQEPHECQGCERQGPFSVNFNQSEYIDGQKIRVEEPPEVAKGGDPAFTDVYLEDDIVKEAESGDRVRISGKLHLAQQSSGNKKKNRFEPYLDAHAVAIKETEFEEIEISDEEESRIRELAEKDIFDLAIGSIAPGITGVDYEDIKLSLFLQLVGGVGVELPDGTSQRGDPHVMMIGDPGTGKSTLMKAIREIAPRSVSVSGDGATKAGITAAAVQDNFADAADWTLEPGALVQANKGVACVDELDKLPDDVANSMHEAMSDQEIPVNKAGINATLPAETAVLAAANPEYGRWNDDLEKHDQITIGSTLLSRFALIWCLEDRPDPEQDREVSDHITLRKDAAKRQSRSDVAADGGQALDATVPEIDADLLRKFIAFARREVPDPIFESESVREKITESYATLRGANGYASNAAVPIGPRKIDDIVRYAEAAARAELSEVITERHVGIAQQLVGESLRQFGQNEDGEMDVDIIETGSSKSQADRKKAIIEYIKANQGDEGGVEISKVVKVLGEDGFSEKRIEDEITNQPGGLIHEGELYEPTDGEVRRWT